MTASLITPNSTFLYDGGENTSNWCEEESWVLGKNNYWCCYCCADSIPYVEITMSTWKINLKERTATSINGITFKLTETNGEYEGVCLNPKNIPPDDLDDVILGIS